VLNEMWGVEFGEAALERIALQLGSDVPACVRQHRPGSPATGASGPAGGGGALDALRSRAVLKMPNKLGH
jgi:4-diphosphocytidyl-2C-methyl-D-erythritol kinase